MNKSNYIKLTKEDLARRFDKYNEKYFDGELPPCKIFISNRLDTAEYNINYNRIIMSSKVCWTGESLKLTLIHEMAHHYVRRVLKKVPLLAHGRAFNGVCDMLKKKYGLRVKNHQLPYFLQKGEKEPTPLKKVLAKCFYYLIRI